MELIFVYNADGTFGAKVRDAITKVAAPSAQECSLCAITYPLFAMARRWREYVAALPYRVSFLHRDEFRSKYPEQKETPLPAVFMQENGVMRAVINSEKINNARNVDDLISLVEKITKHTPV